MNTFNFRRAVQLALALAAGVIATAARADIKDYKFELVDQIVKAGTTDRVITVRLLNSKTGKPVPDAVVFATRLDMAADGMPEMATRIALDPGTAEPGSYRFKATFGMEGRWLLSIGAKVQGETGTLEGKFVITAKK